MGPALSMMELILGSLDVLNLCCYLLAPTVAKDSLVK